MRFGDKRPSNCTSKMFANLLKGPGMSARQRRNQARRRRKLNSVGAAYDQLRECIGGKFEPGYYNSPSVQDAERAGLNVCDAVLGHILASSLNADQEARAFELLNRVSNALVPSEVVNKCHNLHGACALMLDALHVPAVVVWGSVFATGKQNRSFWLNANSAPATRIIRPGHSWLLTPSWRVADLALRHQSNVPGDYEKIHACLPPLITVASNESSEPDVSWWRLERGRSIDSAQYDQSTLYQNVIGWSQFRTRDTTVRYLPGAMTLLEETKLADVKIRIGGLSVLDFFDQNAVDLVP